MHKICHYFKSVVRILRHICRSLNRECMPCNIKVLILKSGLVSRAISDPTYIMAVLGIVLVVI